MPSNRPALLALSGALLVTAASLVSAGPQHKKPVKPAAASANAAQIAAGKKVYDANGCAACHMIGGKGGKTGTVLDSVGKTRNADFIVVAIREPKKHVATSAMPAYNDEKIDAKQLKSLVAYLLSLK